MRMYWFNEQKIAQYAYYKTPKDILKERQSSSWFQREIFLYQVFHDVILNDLEEGRRNKLTLDECRFLYDAAMDMIYEYAISEEASWMDLYKMHWEIKKKITSEELVNLGIGVRWVDDELIIDQDYKLVEKLGFRVNPSTSSRKMSVIDIQITRELRSNKLLFNENNLDKMELETFHQIQSFAEASRNAGELLKRIEKRWRKRCEELGLNEYRI